MEFLKEIIGDQLYAQVAQAIAGRTDVKLANLAEGGYVGKEKFMAAMEKIAALEAELAKSRETLSAAQAASQKADELQNIITALREEKEQIGMQYEQKMSAERLEAAVINALTKAKAKNMKAVRALLDESGVAMENGMLTGLDPQIAALKMSDPYLFEMVRDTGGGTNPTMAAVQAGNANPDRLDDKTFYNLKFNK